MTPSRQEATARRPAVDLVIKGLADQADSPDRPGRPQAAYLRPVHYGMVTDRFRAAMDAVPRVGYLPRHQRRNADSDRPLPIGSGATNSQPTTVLNMLRMLDAREGHRILDVGSGSAWTTAILAHLAGPMGSVRGVEIEPDLVAQGRAHLKVNGVTGVPIHPAASGTLGWPDEAPYDRILVSAGARELPRSLVEQLDDHGRMVIPVAGEMVIVEREGAGLRTTRQGRYRFVPLRGG
ncbi:MAG: class I SAM-dependent methyltransferase [Ornithinimicrobium sp.]